MSQTPNPTTTATASNSARIRRNTLLYRAWERIQYPAGPESRERLQASRKSGGYGW
jgi:hypothetical protein